MITILEAVLLFCAVFIPPSMAQSYDGTLVPGGVGPSMVETVCSLFETICDIFPDDKLFLRRLAFAESNDGLDPKTFRKNYFGGIWQVDRGMFRLTQQTTFPSSYRLKDPIAKIKQRFNIVWMNVLWKDLTKPLYSALAARLYFHYFQPLAINSSIGDQAVLWKTYYRTTNSTGDFSSAADVLFHQACPSVGADVVFLLDTTTVALPSPAIWTSIGQFMKDTVGSTIGHLPGQYKFGLATVNSNVSSVWNLSTYTSESDIWNATDRVVVGPFSGSNPQIHLGLDKMTVDSFRDFEARPIEVGHPRIGIVMTYSATQYTFSNELMYVSEMREFDADITRIAVGLGSGGINPGLKSELEGIASDPDCLGVVTATQLLEVTDLVYRVKQKICNAPVILSSTQDTTVSLTANSKQNCKLKLPLEGSTVKIIVSGGGSVDFFTSTVIFPSAYYYDTKTSASASHSGMISLTPGSPNLIESEVMYLFCSMNASQDCTVTFQVVDDTANLISIGQQMTASLSAGDSEKYYFYVSSLGVTIQIKSSTSGLVWFYASTSSYPNASFNSYNASTSSTQTVTISIPGNSSQTTDTLMYCTIQAASGQSGTLDVLIRNNIDTCQTIPCNNNGSCTNVGYDRYQCNCGPKYFGQNCEYVVTTPGGTTTNSSSTGEGAFVILTPNQDVSITLPSRGKQQFYFDLSSQKAASIRVTTISGGTTAFYIRINGTGSMNSYDFVTQSTSGNPGTIVIPSNNPSNSSSGVGKRRMYCYVTGDDTRDSVITISLTISKDCSDNPCQNDGVCVAANTTALVQYQCSCPPGFTGSNCDKNNDSSITRMNVMLLSLFAMMAVIRNLLVV